MSISCLNFRDRNFTSTFCLPNISMSLCFLILQSWVFFLKDFIYLFLEEMEGEREGEEHLCMVASHMSPVGDLAHNLDLCPSTGNQTSDPLVRRPALNPLSHTSQGTSQVFKSSTHRSFGGLWRKKVFIDLY